MGQRNTAAEAKGLAIKVEEISVVEEGSDVEEVRVEEGISVVEEVRVGEAGSEVEDGSDVEGGGDVEEGSIVEAEDASTVSMWLQDGEVQMQTARSRTPQVWLLQGHTPRPQERILSRAATRRNFMEDECIRLAERKKGWSIKAMKNRLLFNWYRFGLKLNKNTEARFCRRNFHEEWYDERANEPACYPEWF